MRRLARTLGLIVVCATSVVVVRSALTRPSTLPWYPDVEDRADPPLTGTILYLRAGATTTETGYGGGSVGPVDRPTACAVSRPAAGGSEVSYDCGTRIGGIGWTTGDGNVAVFHAVGGGTQAAYERRVFDARSGALIATDRVSSVTDGVAPHATWTGDGHARGDGTVVRVDRTADQAGRRIVVVDASGERRTVLTGAGFEQANWSPDGRWIVVRDTAHRILVVAADGPARTRVLLRVGDDRIVAWWQPGAMGSTSI